MIELRWVERSEPIGRMEPQGMELARQVRVLQYRINTGPRIVKEADGSMGVRDGEWSDWADVPVVKEGAS